MGYRYTNILPLHNLFLIIFGYFFFFFGNVVSSSTSTSSSLSSVPTISSSSSFQRFIYGIGIYNDTTNAPYITAQLPVAFNLTGAQGWILLFFESMDGNTSSSWNPEAWQIQALQYAYSLNLRPIVRLGQYARNYRYYSDDTEHLHYNRLANLYRQYVSQLPLPPVRYTESTGISSLPIIVGNEPNICLEWQCTEGEGIFMNATTIAKEFAAFSRDIVQSLSSLSNLALMIAPLAQAGTEQCECVYNGNNGPQVYNGTYFLSTMLDYVPYLYNVTTYFTAHTYPACGDNPFNDWCARGWLLTYNDVYNIAINSWLMNPVNNQSNATYPIIISETGFQAPQNETGKAEWIIQCYNDIWLPDTRIISVTPFLLAGPFWASAGWPWTLWNPTNINTVETFQPQYLAVQTYIQQQQQRSANREGKTVSEKL